MSKRVYIARTGGTIGMKKTAAGYVKTKMQIDMRGELSQPSS